MLSYGEVYRTDRIALKLEILWLGLGALEYFPRLLKKRLYLISGDSIAVETVLSYYIKLAHTILFVRKLVDESLHVITSDLISLYV